MVEFHREVDADGTILILIGNETIIFDPKERTVSANGITANVSEGQFDVLCHYNGNAKETSDLIFEEMKLKTSKQGVTNQLNYIRQKLGIKADFRTSPYRHKR